MKKSRKRRRRTSSKVPAKGRLRDMADQLWSLSIRLDWANKCAVCGKRGVEAHHLVPRQHEATRYDLWNGIALCPSHHKFDKDVSPHMNAAGWLQWLHDHHRDFSVWLERNYCPKFSGTKNADHYIEHIRRLRQYVPDDKFKRIVGVKFAAYLEDER